MSFLKLASTLCDAGYSSLFPVLCFLSEGKRLKKPLVSAWQEYAAAPPAGSLIASWAHSALIENYAGAGLVTGITFSVLDFDADRILSFDDLLSTFPFLTLDHLRGSVRTAGGGLHVYVKNILKNGVNVLGAPPGGIRMDIRGVGGFVVAPGSVLWSADPSFLDAVLAPAAGYSGELVPPAELLEVKLPELIKQPAYHAIERKEIIPEGERHHTAVSLALKLANNAKDGADLGRFKALFDAMLKQHFADIDPASDEYVRIWESAAQKIKNERGFYWEKVLPTMKTATREFSNAQELSRWPFKIIKAKRIGDILRLTLSHEDGGMASMTMEVPDLYQQNRFRERYTVACNRVLDRINPNAFEQFISGLEIEEVADTGTAIVDIVDDVLQELSSKTIESANIEEMYAALKTRGFAKIGGLLRFKISRLKNEFSVRALKPAALAQAISDTGCFTEGKGIWIYPRASIEV